MGQKIVHMFETFGKIQNLQEKYWIYQNVISVGEKALDPGSMSISGLSCLDQNSLRYKQFISMIHVDNFLTCTLKYRKGSLILGMTSMCTHNCFEPSWHAPN